MKVTFSAEERMAMYSLLKFLYENGPKDKKKQLARLANKFRGNASLTEAKIKELKFLDTEVKFILVLSDSAAEKGKVLENKLAPYFESIANKLGVYLAKEEKNASA